MIKKSQLQLVTRGNPGLNKKIYINQSNIKHR